MDRLVYKELLAWKKAKKHVPILLRGARQVGKTYIVEHFGNHEFKSFTNINFEFTPKFANCFVDMDPQAIINAITAITRQPIFPGETLLFLDEVQQCPKAIVALRYFKEKMPDLHVIAAGSLLEFAINDDAIQMPVGRIRSLYVKPLSFWEYLYINEYHQILDALKNATIKTEIPLAIHQQLETLLREYFVLGGMPEVVSDYQKDKNLLNAQAAQLSILSIYRNDFGKYASKAKHKYLQKIFERAPGLIGQRFQYVKIDPHMKSRDLKTALSMLVDANIMHRVYHSSASGLPLNSTMNENRFKTLFVDVGLTNASSLLNPSLLLQEDLMLLNRGALAEQFVGQELLAYTPIYIPGQLYYWDREKRNSLAEVDYVINVDSSIIPIEVKAGKTGSLKSIQVFCEQKEAPFGVRISLKPLGFRNNILSVPLYMIHELPRLIRELL